MPTRITLIRALYNGIIDTTNVEMGLAPVSIVRFMVNFDTTELFNPLASWDVYFYEFWNGKWHLAASFLDDRGAPGRQQPVWTLDQAIRVSDDGGVTWRVEPLPAHPIRVRIDLKQPTTFSAILELV